MALRIRRFPLHRRGRELTAGRALFVTRRLTGGRDAEGREVVRLPGEPFDPTGIPETRLKALFAGRFIGHELPHGVASTSPQAGPAAPSPAAPPATPSKPAKQPRSSARS